jgi:hypothetical protein
MFVWSVGRQLKRVPKGKKQTLRCGNCKQEASFYESTVDDSFKAFMVLDLWKRSKRVMQCGECLAVCDYYSLYPEEKLAEEEAARAAEEARRKREQEETQKRQEAEAKESARQQEESRKKYEAEKVRKDQEVDDELAQMKKKLGK